MTSLNYDIKEKLKRLTAFERIIVLNIAIYFIGWLVFQTHGIERENSLNWLALPKDFFDFIIGSFVNILNFIYITTVCISFLENSTGFSCQLISFHLLGQDTLLGILES